MSKNFYLFPILIFNYFFILSFNLLGQPLYLDEGLYIFWASLFSNDPNFAYVSMQDGKTPLFIWLTSYLNPFFNSYLYTGRLISVAASAITLICSMLIGWRIIGKKGPLWVFVLFIICPFNILISRMAFVDSLMIAFGSLSLTCLFFLREFATKQKYLISSILAVFAGIFLGLGYLTKSTIRVFLVGEILMIGLWLFPELKELVKHSKNLSLQIFKSGHTKNVFVFVATAIVIYAIYSETLGYLRFGAQRFWGMLSIKEADLTFSLREIFMNLTGQGAAHIYFKNLPLFGEYFLVYFGTILVFFFVGIYQIFRSRQNLWLPLLVLFFSTAVLLSAKILASRYMAIIVPIVLIISAIGANKIWESSFKLKKLLIVMLMMLPALFSFLLITSPLKAVYSSDDSDYFIKSEINVPEIFWMSEYFRQNKNAVLGIQAYWGTAEGLSTVLGEKGIKTVMLSKVIPVLPVDDPKCENGYIENGDCWKINIGSLKDYLDKEIYIYITATPSQIEFLNRAASIKLVKEFKRTHGATSYLFKFEGFKN